MSSSIHSNTIVTVLHYIYRNIHVTHITSHGKHGFSCLILSRISLITFLYFKSAGGLSLLSLTCTCPCAVLSCTLGVPPLLGLSNRRNHEVPIYSLNRLIVMLYFTFMCTSSRKVRLLVHILLCANLLTYTYSRIRLSWVPAQTEFTNRAASRTLPLLETSQILFPDTFDLQVSSLSHLVSRWTSPSHGITPSLCFPLALINNANYYWYGNDECYQDKLDNGVAPCSYVGQNRL